MDFLQRLLSRPGEDFASRMKPRTMTGTIPGARGAVPADDAFEMRADGRAHRYLAIFATEGGDFLSVDAEDFAFTEFQLIHGIAFGFGESVPQHIVRIVEIFFNVTPRATVEFAPIDSEEIEPGIFPSEITIAGHDGAQRAERKAIAAEAGGDELFSRALANEGQ